MSRVIHAGWVCPATSPPIADGAVVVDQGTIVDVIDRPRNADLSFPNAALVPGFVNVHAHLELTVFRGFLEGLAFADWIRTLTRAKYEWMDVADLELSARLGAAECLASGVTTVGDVTDSGAGWSAMRDAGLTGIGYQEVFGPDRSQAPRALDQLVRKIESHSMDETPCLRAGVSPHAPYTVSDDLFRGVAGLARERGWPVAVHLAESSEEVEFVRDGAGPFAANHRDRGIAVTPRGTGPIEYLDGLDVLDSSTLAVHAIHAEPAAIRMLARRDVAVAHCPKSNLKLGHAIAPVGEFLDAGIRVGLGTDSVASNNGIDMFEEMRTAIFVQNTRRGRPAALDAPTVFRMATIGGARCLGLAGRIGSLEAGKQANMAVVRLDGPGMTPVYDPVDALVFSASRGDIAGVFVDGERVEMSTRSLEEEVRESAARLARERARL